MESKSIQGNVFATARGHTDGEEKIGAAFSDVRKEIIIATRTNAGIRKVFCCKLTPGSIQNGELSSGKETSICDLHPLSQ